MEISGWDVAAVLAKTISYAATLGAAGAIFLLAYASAILSAAQELRIRRWIGILSLAAAAASSAKVLLLAASMSGAAAGMFDISLNRMILRAGEGWTVGTRLAGLLLANTALPWQRRGHPFAVLGAILCAASFAGTGHVHAHPLPIVWTALLMLHLVCAAFWLGALVPLYMVAGEPDPARCAALATRFGQIAIGAIVLLLAAGSMVLAHLLGSLSDLWGSDYGRLVSLKILLVVGLLACAAFNRFRFTPALREHEVGAARKLRRSIAVEIVLAMTILLLTAVFTTLLGPDS